jgi:hypothetical protein
MKRQDYPPAIFLRQSRIWAAGRRRHPHRTITLLSIVLFVISGKSISGVDLNNDGMSDVWQQKYSVPSADANLDYDGTGLTNSQKSLLGLDPRNPNSRFHLEIVNDSASNQLHLRLDTVFGKLYQLESSSDLRNWRSFNSAIAGTGSTVEIIQSLTGAQMFFRARFANDIDADNDILSVILEPGGGPTKGNLNINLATGKFTYSPSLNLNGVDSFTYRAFDSITTSNLGTVTINITAVNDAPVAVSDSYATKLNTALTVTAPGVTSNDTDVDNTQAQLTATTLTVPSVGSLNFNNGAFTYTPSTNVGGIVSFTYRLTDTGALSSTATVFINVSSDTPPVAVPDGPFAATEDVAFPGTVANDTDVDPGQTITAILDQNTPPAAGTVALAANGTFVFTPAANYNGPVSFVYHAFDGFLPSNNSVTVTINIGAINDAPVAVNDGAPFTVSNTDSLVVGGSGVLVNDTDVDNVAALNHPVGNQTLTAVLVAAGGPVHGNLNLGTGGAFTNCSSTTVRAICGRRESSRAKH